MPRTFIPFPDGCLVRLRYVHNSGNLTMSNLLHFYTPGGFDGNALDALADMLVDWDFYNGRTLNSASIRLSEIYARSLDVPEGLSVNRTPFSGNDGTRSGAIGNFEATKCVKLQTLHAGRSFRGRLFVAPLPVDAYGGVQIIAPLWGTAALGAYSNLIERAQGLTPYMQWVVASYRTGNAWRLYAIFEPVDQCVFVNRRIDTQRRRLGPRPPV